MVFGEKCLFVDGDWTLAPGQANGRHFVIVRKADAVIRLPQPRAANQAGMLAIANESDGPVSVAAVGRLAHNNDRFILGSNKIALLWAVKESENSVWHGAVCDGLTGLGRECGDSVETVADPVDTPAEKKPKKGRAQK